MRKGLVRLKVVEREGRTNSKPRVVTSPGSIQGRCHDVSFYVCFCIYVDRTIYV